MKKYEHDVDAHIDSDPGNVISIAKGVRVFNFPKAEDECGIPRPLSDETRRRYAERKMLSSAVNSEGYIERMYALSLKEIEYYDKTVVLEAFRRNRVNLNGYGGTNKTDGRKSQKNRFLQSVISLFGIG